MMPCEPAGAAGVPKTRNAIERAAASGRVFTVCIYFGRFLN